MIFPRFPHLAAIALSLFFASPADAEESDGWPRLVKVIDATPWQEINEYIEGIQSYLRDEVDELPAAAATWLVEKDAQLEEFSIAVRIAECSWGIEDLEDVDSLDDVLSEYRGLTRMCLARGLERLAAGEEDQFLRDLLTANEAARRLIEGEFLIQQLLGFSLQSEIDLILLRRLQSRSLTYSLLPKIREQLSSGLDDAPEFIVPSVAEEDFTVSRLEDELGPKDFDLERIQKTMREGFAVIRKHSMATPRGREPLPEVELPDYLKENRWPGLDDIEGDTVEQRSVAAGQLLLYHGRDLMEQVRWRYRSMLLRRWILEAALAIQEGELGKGGLAESIDEAEGAPPAETELGVMRLTRREGVWELQVQTELQTYLQQSLVQLPDQPGLAGRGLVMRGGDIVFTVPLAVR